MMAVYIAGYLLAVVVLAECAGLLSARYLKVEKK